MLPRFTFLLFIKKAILSWVKGVYRNDKAWEGKIVGHGQVVMRAQEYLHAWKWARKRRDTCHVVKDQL